MELRHTYRHKLEYKGSENFSLSQKELAVPSDFIERGGRLDPYRWTKVDGHQTKGEWRRPRNLS